MNNKWGFFPYEAMNYKAAQAYLDRQADRGWALKRVWLGCLARFQRGSARHFVDLDLHTAFDDGPDTDYLQLCADAGWEHLQSLRGMLLFRSTPGADPVPIQSDGEIEWERFWARYRPRPWLTLLLLVFLVLVILLAAIPSHRNLTAALASNSTLLYLLYLLLAVLYLPLNWLYGRWYLARCRRADRVEDPGALATLLDSAARLRTPLLCLILLAVLLEPFGAWTTVDLDWYPMNDTYTATVEACRPWPVVMASDLGLPDSRDSRHLEGHRSLLGSFLEYSELTEGEGPDAPLYILTTERYDCAFPALARWALAQRERETRNGNFLWGALEWEAAPGLGFEESYTCREGSYLLFRQGNVVALVGCSELDLTQPESLAALTRRLDLPPLS